MVFGRRERGREVVLAARMAAAASLPRPRSVPSLSLPPFGLGGRGGGEKRAASWSTAAVSAAAAQQRFRPLRRMTLIYGRAAESPPEKEKREKERAEQRWRNGKQEEDERAGPAKAVHSCSESDSTLDFSGRMEQIGGYRESFEKK